MTEPLSSFWPIQNVCPWRFYGNLLYFMHRLVIEENKSVGSQLTTIQPSNLWSTQITGFSLQVLHWFPNLPPNVQYGAIISVRRVIPNWDHLLKTSNSYCNEKNSRKPRNHFTVDIWKIWDLCSIKCSDLQTNVWNPTGTSGNHLKIVYQGPSSDTPFKHIYKWEPAPVNDGNCAAGVIHSGC